MLLRRGLQTGHGGNQIQTEIPISSKPVSLSVLVSKTLSLPLEAQPPEAVRQVKIQCIHRLPGRPVGMRGFIPALVEIGPPDSAGGRPERSGIPLQKIQWNSVAAAFKTHRPRLSSLNFSFSPAGFECGYFHFSLFAVSIASVRLGQPRHPAPKPPNRAESKGMGTRRFTAKVRGSNRSTQIARRISQHATQHLE